MLDKAVLKNHIIGVLDDLIPGVSLIFNMQIINNTMIIIDGSETSVLNLKLILHCFEKLSGLKINLHKSEVFVFPMAQGRKKG